MKEKLVVYFTDDCYYCHALMEWLDGLGVEYEMVDAREMDDVEVVPETHVGGEVFVGFERREIMRALKKYGLVE